MSSNERIDDLQTPDAADVKGGIPSLETMVDQAADELGEPVDGARARLAGAGRSVMKKLGADHRPPPRT